MQTTHDAQEILLYLTLNNRFTIQLEFGPNDDISSTTTLIGIKEGHYLIFDVPNHLKESIAFRKTKNIDVIIRGIADTELGHIIAFKSRIKHYLTSPESLLFISVPNRFVTKPIRAHERFKLYLDAVLVHDGNQYQGLLADFSVSGCGFKTKVEPEFSVGDSIDLECPPVEFYGANLNGEIISIKKAKLGWMIGILFNDSIPMSSQLHHAMLERHYQHINYIQLP